MASLLTSRTLAMGLACGWLACLGGCDGTGRGSPDGGGGAGYCGADVEAGQACNTLTALGSTVTPTCTADPLPVGTGGTIMPGTYVLTTQTYYGQAAGCSAGPLASTFVLSGSCIQGMDEFLGMRWTSSGTIAVHGNQITFTRTCSDTNTATMNPDVPTETFTATPTTLTLFTPNSAAGNRNPDRAAVFVKQ